MFNMKNTVISFALCFLVTFTTAVPAEIVNNSDALITLTDAELVQAQYYRHNREDVTIRITNSGNQTVDIESPFMMMELQDSKSRTYSLSPTHSRLFS
jgi:hypothetical protein